MDMILNGTFSYGKSIQIYMILAAMQSCSSESCNSTLQMIVGLQAETLEVLKNILQKEEVNWRLALVCVSTYLKFIPEGGTHMKGK
jgi:hypothetical protein